MPEQPTDKTMRRAFIAENATVECREDGTYKVQCGDVVFEGTADMMAAHFGLWMQNTEELVRALERMTKQRNALLKACRPVARYAYHKVGCPARYEPNGECNCWIGDVTAAIAAAKPEGD